MHPFLDHHYGTTTTPLTNPAFCMLLPPAPASGPLPSLPLPQVSTLLLGLVEISAKRYLGRSLLADTPAAKAAAAAAAANPTAPAPAAAAAGAAGTAAAGSMGAAAAAAASASPLPEEERPVAFWEAPYMLLVQVCLRGGGRRHKAGLEGRRQAAGGAGAAVA